MVDSVMIAAPRKGHILQQCLYSWEDAGIKPTVFAEPGEYNAHVDVQHKQKLGPYQNWLYAAKHALEGGTSQTILIIEDDALAHPDILHPLLHVDLKTRIFTAYTFSENLRNKHFGIYELPTGRGYSGALAMFFDRDMLGKIVESDVVQNWPENHGYLPYEHDITDVDHIDVMIGTWAKESGIPILGCHPSLVEHVGDGLSTLGHDNKLYQRKATEFLSTEKRSPWQAGELRCRVTGYVQSSAGMRAMLKSIPGDLPLTIPVDDPIDGTLVVVKQENELQKIIEIL